MVRFGYLFYLTDYLAHLKAGKLCWTAPNKAFGNLELLFLVSLRPINPEAYSENAENPKNPKAYGIVNYARSLNVTSFEIELRWIERSPGSR